MGVAPPEAHSMQMIGPWGRYLSSATSSGEVTLHSLFRYNCSQNRRVFPELRKVYIYYSFLSPRELSPGGYRPRWSDIQLR